MQIEYIVRWLSESSVCCSNINGTFVSIKCHVYSLLSSQTLEISSHFLNALSRFVIVNDCAYYILRFGFKMIFKCLVRPYASKSSSFTIFSLIHLCLDQIESNNLNTDWIEYNMFTMNNLVCVYSFLFTLHIKDVSNIIELNEPIS